MIIAEIDAVCLEQVKDIDSLPPDRMSVQSDRESSLRMVFEDGHQSTAKFDPDVKYLCPQSVARWHLDTDESGITLKFTCKYKGHLIEIEQKL